MLAVRKIAANLFADHHAQFVDAQFSACSVVAPVIVVCTTNGVKLVWMFVLNGFSSLLLRHLVPKLVWLWARFTLHVLLPVLLCHLINKTAQSIESQNLPGSGFLETVSVIWSAFLSLSSALLLLLSKRSLARTRSTIVTQIRQDQNKISPQSMGSP